MKLWLLALAACASPRPAPLAKPLETAPLAVIQSFPGIDLMPSFNAVFYEHAGDPATVKSMVLMFEVQDHRAHAIEVRKLELLHRHCRSEHWDDRKTIELGEIVVTFSHDTPDTGTQLVASGRTHVTIPAHEPSRYAVQLGFAKPLVVYQKCDDFAYGLDLVVDSIRHQTETLFEVNRSPETSVDDH